MFTDLEIHSEAVLSSPKEETIGYRDHYFTTVSCPAVIMSEIHAGQEKSLLDKILNYFLHHLGENK